MNPLLAAAAVLVAREPPPAGVSMLHSGLAVLLLVAPVLHCRSSCAAFLRAAMLGTVIGLRAIGAAVVVYLA